MKYAYDTKGQEIARALLLVNLLAELRVLIDPQIRNNGANEFGVDTTDGFIVLGTIEDERV